MSSSFAETSKDIGRENTTNDVSQMGDVVDIGKSAGNEDIALALLGKDGS